MRRDVIAGAVLAGLGGYVAWRAAGWDLMTEEGPGPGFFPLGYGVLMLALSLALIVAALRRAPPPGTAQPPDHARALLTWAVFAVSALLMDRIGFVAGFAILTLFMVVHVFHRGWGRGVAVAACCAAGFWLVFAQLLAVELPTGPWGF